MCTSCAAATILDLRLPVTFERLQNSCNVAFRMVLLSCPGSAIMIQVFFCVSAILNLRRPVPPNILRDSIVFLGPENIVVALQFQV